jgi:hypothetical protein
MTTNYLRSGRALGSFANVSSSAEPAHRGVPGAGLAGGRGKADSTTFGISSRGRRNSNQDAEQSTLKSPPSDPLSNGIKNRKDRC